jgi:hypothetical protein
MAEDKRTLWSDLKKNILDVGWKGDITKGDKKRYSIKDELRSQEYPFKTRPKKKKKADIETLNDFQRLLIETSERVSKPKKKPVKYTAEGAFDAASLLGIIPLQGYALAKLESQKQSKKFQKRK